MPIPSTQFRNNDLAAHAVYRHIKTLQPPVDYLTLRPWNPYQPAHTAWYLVPGTEWPAYRFGKLFVNGTSKDKRMGLGFYVERGLGAHLAGMVKPTQLMNADWSWPRFREETRAGALDDTLQTVLERTYLPVQVYLNLFHFNHVPDVETGEQHPDDELAFEASDASLTFKGMLSAKNELSGLNEATGLRDLIERVEGLPNLAWTWINLWIGVRVCYAESDTGDWDAAQVWHKALEPWLRWVRPVAQMGGRGRLRD